LALLRQQCKRQEQESPPHSWSWTPTFCLKGSGQKGSSCPALSRSLPLLCPHLPAPWDGRNHSPGALPGQKPRTNLFVRQPNSLGKRCLTPLLWKIPHTAGWSMAAPHTWYCKDLLDKEESPQKNQDVPPLSNHRSRRRFLQLSLLLKAKIQCLALSRK